MLQVTGNYIFENLGTGIVVSEAADAVELSGNTIIGNGQGGIAVDTEATPRIVHNLLKLNRYRGRCVEAEIEPGGWKGLGALREKVRPV